MKHKVTVKGWLLLDENGKPDLGVYGFPCSYETKKEALFYADNGDYRPQKAAITYEWDDAK
jgi:hypothetical protein